MTTRGMQSVALQMDSKSDLLKDFEMASNMMEKSLEDDSSLEKSTEHLQMDALLVLNLGPLKGKLQSELSKEFDLASRTLG